MATGALIAKQLVLKILVILSPGTALPDLSRLVLLNIGLNNPLVIQVLLAKSAC